MPIHFSSALPQDIRSFQRHVDGGEGALTYGIIAGGTTRRRACDVDLGTHGANTTVQASHVLAESPRIPDRIRVQLDSH
jgi:hypothetical protein